MYTPTTKPTPRSRDWRDTARRFGIGTVAVASTVALSGVTSINASPIGTSLLGSNVTPASVAGPDDLRSDVAEVFIGVTPTRILDTRAGIGVDVAAPLGPDEWITVDVVGVNGIPPQATSVALNTAFTAQATSPSFMTIWPTGEEQPYTAVNNASPGVASPNFVVSKLGDGGRINVYNERGDADIVLDVAGYYVPMSEIDKVHGGGELWSGDGAPGGGVGGDGDFYIDEDTGLMYGPKTDDEWGGPMTAPETGDQGPALLTGEGAPAPGEGDVDDMYFDLDAPAFYGPKTASGWGPAIAVGPDGTGSSGSTVFVESRTPTASDGADGDIFLDDEALDLYGPKTAGDWGTPVSLDTGSDFLVGSGAPDDVSDGIDGDMYLDDESLVLYGPKAGGVWPAGTDLNGSIMLTGVIPPTDGDGSDGDMYIDTNTLTIYGPKSGGTWPAGQPLTGAPTALTDSAFSAYSNGVNISVSVASSTAIDFENDGVSVGSAISRVDVNTFVFNTAGTYKVSYVVAAGLAVGGSIGVEVDGLEVPGRLVDLDALATSSTTELVHADAGDTLEIVLSSALGVGLGVLDSSLMVELVAID